MALLRCLWSCLSSKGLALLRWEISDFVEDLKEKWEASFVIGLHGFHVSGIILIIFLIVWMLKLLWNAEKAESWNTWKEFPKHVEILIPNVDLLGDVRPFLSLYSWTFPQFAECAS